MTPSTYDLPCMPSGRYANSLMHGLPFTHATNAAGERTAAPSRLYLRTGEKAAEKAAKGAAYWRHFDELLDEAEERQRRTGAAAGVASS